jgi:hypothetical protein
MESRERPVAFPKEVWHDPCWKPKGRADETEDGCPARHFDPAYDRQRGAHSPAIHNHKLTAADYDHIMAILANLSL